MTSKCHTAHHFPYLSIASNFIPTSTSARLVKTFSFSFSAILTHIWWVTWTMYTGGTIVLVYSAILAVRLYSGSFRGVSEVSRNYSRSIGSAACCSPISRLYTDTSLGLSAYITWYTHTLQQIHTRMLHKDAEVNPHECQRCGLFFTSQKTKKQELFLIFKNMPEQMKLKP